jgi:restriction system protein
MQHQFWNVLLAIPTTPEESMETALQSLQEALLASLLDRIRLSSPSRFEEIVVDLLVGMGYGGSRADAAQVLGKSRDEGIDGFINEDRLGLDVIYVQAKQWEKPVGRPEIQKFAGALSGQHARKGIFVTSSEFTKEARDFAAKIENKIILVDGRRMAELMIEHGIGVSAVFTYAVKRVDSDYFEEE